MKILLTGASGMLGRYIMNAMRDGNEISTLQRHEADINCDLTCETPNLGDTRYDLVVHAAGSSDDANATELNIEGTRRLLDALSANPPEELVYVSSWEVYSPDAGEEIDETHQTWASSKTGQSKARAELLVEKWAKGKDVRLTIIRPARMFGKGVKGEMATLYNDVRANRYIHVRGNEARLSLVCALDVAEAIRGLHPIGGIFNISDGEGATWIRLAEAMSANAGAAKRQTFLPEKWAAAAWKYLPSLPHVKASLSPEVLARRSKTLTLSNKAAKEALPWWKPFPTIDVISRECGEYPYLDPI